VREAWWWGGIVAEMGVLARPGDAALLGHSHGELEGIVGGLAVVNFEAFVQAAAVGGGGEGDVEGVVAAGDVVDEVVDAHVW